VARAELLLLPSSHHRSRDEVDGALKPFPRFLSSTSNPTWTGKGKRDKMG